MGQVDEGEHFGGVAAAQGAGDLRALLRAVARGETAAFDIVYQQLRAPVQRLVQAVLRDEAQAEEVAQEVLLEVWRTAARYDPARGSVTAWVLTIAHHRAVDRVRAASAATAREQRAMPPPAAWDQVGEAAQEAVDRERLERGVSQLTPRQQEVIRLAFYGGNSYERVARILGVPAGTVKSRIRGGLARLRDSMLGED